MSFIVLLLITTICPDVPSAIAIWSPRYTVTSEFHLRFHTKQDITYIKIKVRDQQNLFCYGSSQSTSSFICGPTGQA